MYGKYRAVFLHVRKFKTGSMPTPNRCPIIHPNHEPTTIRSAPFKLMRASCDDAPSRKGTRNVQLGRFISLRRGTGNPEILLAFDKPDRFRGFARHFAAALFSTWN
jgi:hypothetical protein